MPIARKLWQTVYHSAMTLLCNLYKNKIEHSTCLMYDQNINKLLYVIKDPDLV